ncbi:hypothetical protein [Streptomyces sp. NBC_00470]|uniref:hypothetical protein n=1 Tax=Streptomyces sp. NBC_00470 TaxID=2975753 RepID=UPI002F911F53
MGATNNDSPRTRYHVGSRDIGGAEYRVECIPTWHDARDWLHDDVANTASWAQDQTEFDAFLERLETMTEADGVGEHSIDAYTFYVHRVTACGCPCKCDATGQPCDGTHRREAAPAACR